jgi:hypothetical protein
VEQEMKNWLWAIGSACIVFAVSDLGNHLRLPLWEQILVAGAFLGGILALSRQPSPN